MARTWSYRKREINVLAPKQKGLAAAVWAYIIFGAVFVSLLTAGVIFLCTHAQPEDDSTPSMSAKVMTTRANGS
jgi:hypothetical protein